MEEMKLPVLLIFFNRSETTLAVFEQIRLYKPNKLYLKSDGARLNRKGEEDVVIELRKQLIKSIDWDCEVRSSFEDSNLGCKGNIQKALSWFFEEETSGIILEDDTVPNQQFFDFMEKKLIEHKEDPDVLMISGTNLIEDELYLHNPIKSEIVQVWGWSTWREKYKLYKEEIDLPTVSIPKLFLEIYKKIDIRAAIYFLACFLLVKNKRLNTWDYQMQMILLQNKMKCVIPATNLVTNIGIVGAHSEKPDRNHGRRSSCSERNSIITSIDFENLWSRKFSSIQYNKRGFLHFGYIIYCMLGFK